MKYRVIDMYENPQGDLVYESDNLLSVILAAESHCIDTDDECKLIIQTNDGINIMFGEYYYDFTAGADLLRGLIRIGLIKQEGEKK